MNLLKPKTNPQVLPIGGTDRKPTSDFGADRILKTATTGKWQPHQLGDKQGGRK